MTIFQDPEQDGACHQPNEDPTHAEFRRAAVNQHIYPAPHLSIRSQAMAIRLTAFRAQFAAEQGQPPDAGPCGCLTDLADRESDIADGFSRCHSIPPAGLVGTNRRLHGVNLESSALAEHWRHMRNMPCTSGPNQGVLEGNGSKVKFHSPLERWKGESLEESPWFLISCDEATDIEPLAPRAKL